MATIIAGRFEQKPEADRAIDVLRRRGFGSDQLNVFYLNPPGQHAKFPVGGDENVSPGAPRPAAARRKAHSSAEPPGLPWGLPPHPWAGSPRPSPAPGWERIQARSSARSRE